MESQNIEYKQSWRDEYLKWICGYANADGGKLYIGKEDAGVVVGIPDAKKLLESIPNKVRDILGIIVDVNLHTKSKLQFLEIAIDTYPYPVDYKGQYHYRSGSTKQELKGAALDKFLLGKQGKHWDGVPVPNLKVSHFDKKVVEIFKKRASQSKRISTEILKESISGLMDKLHLKDGSYFKRAAILLFHKDPEKFVTGAFVKIGFFRTNSDLLYHDEIHGDLFTQVDKTMELLLSKYLKAGIDYQGVQRVESFPVPEAALREALLNALIHKDYATGTPVQISVYSNKMMLWNPGVLPDKWTIKKLKGKHPSQPFNPDIASVFFRAGMIEAWGRGIERILYACKKAKVPSPNIRYEDTGLWVEFTFPKIKTLVETPVETPVETAEEKPQKTPDLILRYLNHNSKATLAQVANSIGKSLSAVERASSKLVKEGKLKHIGPTKSGYWEVTKEH